MDNMQYHSLCNIVSLTLFILCTFKLLCYKEYINTHVVSIVLPSYLFSYFMFILFIYYVYLRVLTLTFLEQLQPKIQFPVREQ